MSLVTAGVSVGSACRGIDVDLSDAWSAQVSVSHPSSRSTEHDDTAMATSSGSKPGGRLLCLAATHCA